jgi:predicted dehydrogenase
MTDKIRLALAGCGSISLRGILPHVALAAERLPVELTAVCDVVAERAQAAAAQFGARQSFSSLEAMLAQAPVDVVLIATPIPYHFDNAMLAIEHGKHVYLQKTMTTTTAEADTLIEAARQKNVMLVASPGQMLSPAYQQLREALQAGLIGRPYWAIVSTAFVGHEFEPFRAGNPIDPTWYYKPGGGPMYDMTVYPLHAITGLLGPARRVTAMSGIGLPERRWLGGGTQVEMDDNTVLLLECSDCFVVAGGHFCQTGKVIGWGFTGIYGSSGTLEITGLADGTAYPAAVEVVKARAAAGLPEGSYTLDNLPVPRALRDEQHARLPEIQAWVDIEHMLDCILHGRAPVASAEHARHVIEIIEKGYLAARTGQAQEVSSTFTLETIPA